MTLLKNLLSDHRSWVDERPSARLSYWIILAAGLSLFLELALIRWHASMLSLFGFYKNFSLLAVFLGLGIGYAMGQRRAIYLSVVFLGLTAQCGIFGLIKLFRWHHVLSNPIGEFLTMGLESTQGALHFMTVLGFLSLMFVLTALTMIPLGQLTGRLMGRLSPLSAYGYNLVGSLAGIGLFTLASYLWTPPAVWFGVSFVCLLLLAGRHHKSLPVLGVLALVVTVLCDYDPKVERKHLYSPYQSLTLSPTSTENRILVSVNHLYYQKIHDFSQSESSRTLNNYNIPFFLAPQHSQVLIVGAGTGNDVTAALAHGVDNIDAVEIDPVIHRLGFLLNPARPYQDTRVTSILTDARSHIRQTDKLYDLIIYGLLDSHTTLSNLSNVRLDSFVYTVEGFRESLRRLKPSGVMTVTFSLIHDDLGRKLFNMLKEASSGVAPLVVQPQAWNDGGIMFIAGPGLSQIHRDAIPLNDVTARYANGGEQILSSTDDWPFFYMPKRQYPVSYTLILMWLLGLSVLLLRACLKGEKENWSKDWASGWVLFCLGAGFMLIETRAITELALTFGNTWLVVAIVISAILAMSYLSNLVVPLCGEGVKPFVLPALLLSVLLGWQVSPYAAQGELSKGVVLLVIALPIFFSGFLFSSVLQKTRSVSKGMAFNLFGAMCGGLLEYNSMYFGFRSLYLLALALYGLSAVGLFFQKRTVARLIEETRNPLNGEPHRSQEPIQS